MRECKDQLHPSALGSGLLLQLQGSDDVLCAVHCVLCAVMPGGNMAHPDYEASHQTLRHITSQHSFRQRPPSGQDSPCPQLMGPCIAGGQPPTAPRQ